MAKRKKRRKRKRPRGTVGAAAISTRQSAALDVVIPVYGRADLLQECVTALEREIADIDAQVVLVDDESPDQDEVAEVYRRLPHGWKVIHNARNMGFPATCNRGVAQGRAPLILLLSTDIVMEPGCLTAMMREFSDPQVGIVGPKLLFPDSGDPNRPAGKIQHAGLCVDIQGNILHANLGWRADHPKVNQRRELQAVTGGCLMTRREVWSAVVRYYKKNGDPSDGAFNVVYGRGTYEDVEYCIAARGHGYKVVYQPEAVATHHVGASITAVGQGFALEQNGLIFRARCGKLLAWDMWRFC